MSGKLKLLHEVSICHDCSVFVLSIFHLTEELLTQVCRAKQANHTQCMVVYFWVSVLWKIITIEVC